MTVTSLCQLAQVPDHESDLRLRRVTLIIGSSPTMTFRLHCKPNLPASSRGRTIAGPDSELPGSGCRAAAAGAFGKSYHN